MCFILVTFRRHQGYPLVVAANRDEYYARRCHSARWWNDPVIFGGRDEVAGGTWLAVDARGRFAAVTNYRDPRYRRAHPHSRGELIPRYLASNLDVRGFGALLAANAGRYAPFNMLFGGPRELGYFNNRDNQTVVLEPGVYGLGNALLDTPWPKLVDGKQLFEACLADHQPNEGRLFEILSRRDVYADDLLPNTGLPLERERALSALFIEDGDYGTRCSTVFMLDRAGTASFAERNHAGEVSGDRSPRVTFQVERESTRR